jgi:MFS family permease
MQTTPTHRRTRLQVFTALKHSGFRRFWLGMVASVMGFQIMMVAQGWLVYDLTDSKLFLGYLGLAAGVPTIVLSLIGGVVADKVNQRRLLMLTQSISGLVMLVLATLVLLDMVQVWHLMVTAFLIGSVQAFDGPTRQAIFPHLIEREDMMNAVALNSMVWQGTRVIGPALGGIIIGTRLGIAPGFYAAFAGFLIMAFMVSTLRLPPIKRTQGTSVAQDMAEGIKFVRTNKIFTFLIGMSFFNSMFGMSYIFLFPVFAKDIFETGASGLGFLSAATGMGGLLGTFTTASLGNFQRKGWLLLGGAVFFGIFLILFAITSSLFASLPLAMGLIFLAGACTSIYMISILTTLQSMVPNELRGRVMGIYGMTFSVLPLGGMQAGAVAEFTSAPFAVALGGGAIILFAVGMAVTNSQVRNIGMQAATISQATT